MGKIVKPLRIFGAAGETTASVLLDSGAGLSLVRRDVAQDAGAAIQRLHFPQPLSGVDGREAFVARDCCPLELEMKGKMLRGLFYVIDQMPRQAIIGVDFLQTWCIRLDPKEEDYDVGIDPEEGIEIASSPAV